MTREQIRKEVKEAAPEPSLTDNDYNNFIEDAIKEVCARIPHPDLKVLTTVNTVLSQNYCSLSGLSGGFSGILRRVRTSMTVGDISIYPSLEMLMDDYESFTDAGAVEAVCLEGSTLWYVKVPAVAQTLTVLYTRNPAALSSDTSEPIFPPYLHRELCVNGAAKRIWEKIEIDIEQPKIQSAAHSTLFESGILEYKNYMARTRKHWITSYWGI